MKIFFLNNDPVNRIIWLGFVLLFSTACIADNYVLGNLRMQVNINAPLKDNENHKISLKLADNTTGKDVKNLKPRMWLTLRRSEQVATETSCNAKIKNFLSGQLATRADIDLNSYLLITLNQDKTVSFIDPHVNWSGGKLKAIVQLPDQGLDWVLSNDGKWLYVTMPQASAIAVIDTVTFKLIKTIDTGKNTKPTRLAFSPDGKSLWVGLDDSAKVAVIENNNQYKVNLIDVGHGLHQLAFTPDARLALVTNSSANTVSLIDIKKRENIVNVPVGKTPLKPVWMSKAERFYVPLVNDDSLVVINPDKQLVEANIDMSRGIVEAKSDPDGRFLWLLNQVENKLLIIDTATNRSFAFANLTADPDQIVFTEEYAYIRELGSEKFSLINRNQLDHLTSGNSNNTSRLIELSITQVQAGEKPPAQTPEAIGVAAMMLPTPENNGVMIANAPGQTIYYYAEGMMVPMGTLDNYRRTPRGLMLLNNSLSETSPGLFEAPLTIEKSGNYDVALLVDQPRITHCFTAKLEASQVADMAQTKPRRIDFHFKPLAISPLVNQETLMSFTLKDHTTEQPITGISDARLLVFEPPGLWQKRLWLKETQPGLYETTISFPHRGLFNVLMEVASQGINFIDQPLATIKVGVEK
jgi:YVTN family beta-propeller protein